MSSQARISSKAPVGIASGALRLLNRDACPYAPSTDPGAVRLSVQLRLAKGHFGAFFGYPRTAPSGPTACSTMQPRLQPQPREALSIRAISPFERLSKPPAAYIWMARLSTAASFTASVKVGCARQVRARSSAEPPNSMSTAASAIISLAFAETMCTPSTRFANRAQVGEMGPSCSQPEGSGQPAPWTHSHPGRREAALEAAIGNRGATAELNERGG